VALLREAPVNRRHMREGALARGGEPIVEVVTDKVNAEIPSPFEGKLVKISATEGEVVRVGGVIAQIEVDGAGGGEPPMRVPGGSRPPAGRRSSHHLDSPGGRPRARRGSGPCPGPRAGP